MWTFFNYLSERGLDEIEEWEKTLPAKAVIRLDMILGHLATMTGTAFDRPYVGVRKGAQGVYEIVIKCGGRQFRPLGCYGPKTREFTLLIGAEEKGNKLEPQSADEIALKRRQEILKDPKRAKEREKPDEQTEATETPEK